MSKHWEINSKTLTMLTEQRETVQQDRCYVAVPEWAENDGIANMIGFELEQLGYSPVLFFFDRPVPEKADYLLTFGPYNRILPLWQNNARLEPGRRPVVIHWNTEGMPDLRIPYGFVRVLGSLRSKIGRMGYSGSALDHFLYSLGPVASIDQSFKRYRYHGDYEYACQQGWLNVLSDSSHIYSQIRSGLGVPTLYAPWGASKRWYADLGLERDIDVLWMGKRGSQRRSRILDQVFRGLKLKGLKVYIADNEENPFIFGDERIRYLNRAKITLNITRTWYDDNFSRFTLACSNHSMIVSEPVLPHCLEFRENVHYVAAKIEDLVDTVVYYVKYEEERRQIVDNAYRLLLAELKFERSLRRMLAAAQQYRTGKAV